MKYIIVTFIFLLAGCSKSSKGKIDSFTNTKYENSKVTEKDKMEKKQEAQFIAVSRNDSKLQSAYENARETLPEFFKLKEQKDGDGLIDAVKVKVYDIKHSEKLGENRFVYLWFYQVHKVENNYIGMLYELPEEDFNGMKTGEYINFTEDLIHDWMIMKEGNLWGGYTIRVIRESKTTEEDKKKFDKHSGIKAYKPLSKTP